MAQLEQVFYVPVYYNIEGFAYLTYKEFTRLTPKKSGNMASYNEYDYDEDSRLLYLTNSCVYGAYQDYETNNILWFEDATKQAYEHTLATMKRLSDEEVQKDWWMSYLKEE